MKGKYAAALLTALSCVVLVTRVHAQKADELRPTISIVGGTTNYDLAGTGDRRLIAMRMEWPVSRYLIVQPGLAYMNYRNQVTNSAPRWHVWFPEVQAQAVLPLGVIQPYLGAGAGVAVQSFQGEQLTEATLSAAAGLRVRLPAGFGIGGELRIRAIDPWHGSTADLAVSVARRL